MSNIQAIETRYKGYRFRSRTEARWAVFFDDMGYSWQYELEDFYIKGIGFAEVKGDVFTEQEKQKCLELSTLGSMVLLLDGPPDEKSYQIFLDGQEMSNAIFIPDGHKYSPLYYGYDWDNDYFSETLESIHRSRAARF